MRFGSDDFPYPLRWHGMGFRDFGVAHVMDNVRIVDRTVAGIVSLFLCRAIRWRNAWAASMRLSLCSTCRLMRFQTTGWVS